MEQIMDTVMSEISERKNRERNIVVFGVSDQTAQSGIERKKQDLVEIQKVFSACRVGLKEDEVLRISRRVNYKNPEGDRETCTSKRPILVVLESMLLKRDLFRNISNLRSNEEFTGIHVSNDMPHNERRAEKKLRDEAKEKEEKSSREFIFRVRRPPWTRRIVKIAKSAQKEETGNKSRR